MHKQNGTRTDTAVLLLSCGIISSSLPQCPHPHHPIQVGIEYVYRLAPPTQLSRELLIPTHHRRSQSLRKQSAFKKKKDWDDDVSKNDKDDEKLSEDG
eukprot:scaffold64143_cov68-Attheya_sp.AAC.5